MCYFEKWAICPCCKCCKRNQKPKGKYRPVLCLILVWLTTLVLGTAVYAIDVRAERSLQKAGCALAVAFNELMEGATLITGEKWQGINNIDEMLIELRD